MANFHPTKSPWPVNLFKRHPLITHGKFLLDSSFSSDTRDLGEKSITIRFQEFVMLCDNIEASAICTIGYIKSGLQPWPKKTSIAGVTRQHIIQSAN